MSFAKNYCLLFFFTFFFPLLVRAQIIPTPQKRTFSTGQFAYTNALKISLYNDSQSKNLYTAELLNKTLKTLANLSVNLELNVKEAQIVLAIIDEKRALELNFPASKLKEAYRLTVKPERISIEAVNPQGILHGAITLIQLFEKATNNTIPAQEILDYPDMEIRGVSDDISRGQISNLDNFKKIIQHLARYKMNTFMLYIEDVLQFDQYPEIGRGRGALNKQEVKEIVSFAAKYYIDVIPVFETLGHQENLLALEQYQNLAEFPGAMSFATSNELVYKYLETTIKEIATLFPSPYLHIGGDESFDAGLEKSKIQAIQLGGLANLHSTHYKRVYAMCKKYNKQVMMYGDMFLKHPEMLKQLPKDIIIMDWQYRAQASYPSVNLFKEAGFKYTVSPTAFNFKSVFPLHYNSFPNVYEYTKTGLHNQARGMINTNWGDLGSETFKELLYYNYAWSAECSWNFKATDFQQFNKSFFSTFFGTDNGMPEKVYKSLSQPFNQVGWHEFWRHPLLEPKKNLGFWYPAIDYTSKLMMMKWDSAGIKKDLDSLRKVVKLNLDHLDILELVNDMHQYYAFKINTHQVLQAYAKERKGNLEYLIGLIELNIEKIEKLQERYQKIWNLYYKPEGLVHISKKFERLIVYFQETKDHLIGGTFPVPLIPSQWIYSPKDKDSLNCHKDAMFRKEINLTEIPEIAMLQFMADTYAELYINGNFIDKVYIRNIFSIHLDPLMVKMINIKDKLKVGLNLIEFRVTNYNQGLKDLGYQNLDIHGGVNAIIHFKTGSQSDYIYTDKDWKAKYWDPKNLESPWKTAITKKYRYEVLAPNFLTERPSWIER
jgi:hypothetical protein